MLCDSRQTAIAALRGELARFQSREGRVRTPTGLAALDRVLPDSGIKAGTLVDWLYAGVGNGAGTLALLSARQTLGREKALIVIDPRRQFYPPAAAGLGIGLEQMVVIYPDNNADALWAWEQSLRSPAAGAVWGTLEDVEPRAFRRLQLAAEAGGAAGHLVRPASVRGRPCWAAIQLLVELTGEDCRRVTVIRGGGGTSGREVEFDLREAAAVQAPMPPAAGDARHSARMLPAARPA